MVYSSVAEHHLEGKCSPLLSALCLPCDLICGVASCLVVTTVDQWVGVHQYSVGDG